MTTPTAERRAGARERDRIARRARSSLGMMWISRAGKLAAVARGALVGREIDRDAAPGQRRASASAGNRCPPVPPAATQHERRAARADHAGLAGAAAHDRLAEQLGARPLARQREQHPHAIGERDQRRAAVGDERQRHALGRHEMQVDRHVDGGLQAEQDREPGGGEARERILVAQRMDAARAAR